MSNPIRAIRLCVPGNRWTTTRLPNRARTSLLSLSFLVLSTLVSACATEAASLNIEAGHVFFQSQPESVLNLGNVPAGFFGTVEGEPSDAIELSNPLRVPIEGRPTGPMGLVGSNLGDMQDVWTAPMGSHWIVHTVGSIRASSPGVKDTDTIVRLTNSLTLDYVGDTGTIGLEMVSLSLQSQAPIEVTYGGDRYSASFHVISVLDPKVTQRQGTMTVTRTGDRSGTLDVRMPGAFRLEFVNTDPNGPRVHDPLTADVDLTAHGVTFKVPPPARR